VFKLKKYKVTKETLRRALRTFIQAFLGYVIINAAVIDFSDDKEVMKSSVLCFLISAAAAGLAAVMNLETPALPEEEVSDIG
jgi:hypothetical protein